MIRELRKFVYTSSHLEGEVTLGYDKESEYLFFFDLAKSNPTNDQHVSLLRNFPFTLAELKALVGKDKDNRKLIEVVEIVTFTMFWDAYNYKTLSHKIKTERAWNKLSDADQIKAFQFIPKYNKEIGKTGIAKMHAQTYLNSFLWNN